MRTSFGSSSSLSTASSRPAGTPRLGRRLVIAATLAAAISVAACGSSDGTSTASTTTGASASTTTVAPTTSPAATTTTVAPTTTAAAAVDRSTAVWPSDPADSSTDPVVAATTFATDFLGFTAPVVGAYQAGDTRSGEIEVRPVANGPVTTVLLRQLGGETTWSVLGTATADIELTTPAAGATITSPVALAGQALAFEGTVQVQVRQDGSTDPIGSGFVTGGGDVKRPFTGSVPFTAPGADYGAVVLFTESGENGQVWQASVIRVRLR